MKKFWQNFKLKMMLSKIWFLKNLWLFVQIALLTLVVLIFTGAVTPDTPVLGKSPLIKDLIVEIYTAINEGGIKDIMTFFSVLLSVMLSVGMFLLKARSITQADIKSDKLKIALVTANLYFNKDGRLVKKVEKATGADINGDGKIDEEEDTEFKGGIIKRTINAVKEFTLIMSADFSEDEKQNEDTYKKVIEDAELGTTEEASKEISVIIADGQAQQQKDIIDAEIDKKIDETEKSDNTEEVKESKVHFLKRLKEWFHRMIEANKERRAKRKEEKEARKAAKKAAKVKVEQPAATEEKKPDVQVVTAGTVIVDGIKQEQPKQEPQKKNDVDAFIAGIKHRK